MRKVRIICARLAVLVIRRIFRRLLIETFQHEMFRMNFWYRRDVWCFYVICVQRAVFDRIAEMLNPTNWFWHTVKKHLASKVWPCIEGMLLDITIFISGMAGAVVSSFCKGTT